MTAEWLLPVMILVPFMAAPFPLALGRLGNGTKIGWSITAAALGLEAVLVSWLAYTVYHGGRMFYQVGGTHLSRPDTFAVGIELLADQVSIILVSLVVVVALGVVTFSRHVQDRTNVFYTGYLLLAGGLTGVFLTHDIFNLFVFMEITGLTTYALIASRQDGRSAVASLKYLMIGTVGASLYLIGVGYVYMATGTLNMSDLSLVLAGEQFVSEPLYTNTLVQAGFAFIATGLLIKSAIFPLHTWQPGAYDMAPDDVTAYVAALVSTAGAYVLGRLVFTVFTPAFFQANPVAAELLIGVSSISIVAGSVLAALQHRIKRMFAYSSVAQFGIIVAAFGVAAHPAGSSTALVGGIIHLAGHGMLKAGLFLGIGLVTARYGVEHVNQFAGLSQRLPVGAGGIAVLSIALVGVPPSIGFLGKWYIALGAVESGLWPVAAVILFSTMLTLLYVARLLETMYFTPQTDTDNPGTDRTTGSDTVDTTLIPDGQLMTFVVLVAAAGLAITLGFAGEPLHDLLAPFIEEVYGR